MKLNVSNSKAELGKRAAADGAALVRQAIDERGEANVIVATGASQFEMLAELIRAPGIRWAKSRPASKRSMGSPRRCKTSVGA